VYNGGLGCIVAVAEAKLAVAVAAHGPQLTAVLQQQAVGEAAGEGGDAEVGEEGARGVDDGGGGGGLGDECGGRLG